MQKGLIISNISNLYYVKSKEEIFECIARGKFKKQQNSPVVGDIVEIEITDFENKKAVIENINERTVYIKRPKISNITQIVLVVSLKMPKPDLLMLDKQIAFAEYLKIKPIIVFNKIDLEQEENINKLKKMYEQIGYKVILTNAKLQTGILELKQELRRNISAFSGNSGVGKSTLINGIFKCEITKEGTISSKNKRGKNTTTQVKLYELEENTFIADTPGFSTFDINEIKSEDLENYFIEFNDYIKKCAYVGCTHIKEEDCGIKKAVEEGHIYVERYERFKKIYKELKESEAHKW